VRITSGTFAGSVGPLEYVLNEPDSPDGAERTAVVCHPHPLHGGTLHTRIVFQMACALAEMGMPTLRFNFRGVGASAGKHDRGIGETDDTRAAIEYMAARYSRPIVLGGFSFGCAVALRLLASESPPGVERFVGVGLPASSEVGTRLPEALMWSGPKLFISGTRDQYGSVAAVTRFVDLLAPPKRLIWIEGADHFLNGHLEEFRGALRAHLLSDWRGAAGEVERRDK
jgi:alpha/beta superfamily hydrolase